MKEIVVLMTALVLFSCGNNAPNSIEEKPNNKSKIEKGPRFNLTELLTIKDKSASQFENYVMEKGYKLHHTEEKGDTLNHYYKYLADEKINGTRYNLSFTFPKPGKNFTKRVDWFFINNRQENSIDTIYLNIKKETENAGFKCWNLNSFKEITNYSYVKGTTFVDFNVGKLSGTDIPMYGVSISNLPELK